MTTGAVRSTTPATPLPWTQSCRSKGCWGLSELERLTLSDEPDAASRARRFVQAALDGTRFEVRADDAVLVVSEMVTNALLHAEPPVSVDLVVLEEHLRIEVRDGAHRPVVETPSSTYSTTGRGLSVVEALSARWGMEPEGGGKLVWAELGDTLSVVEHEGEIDLDAWDDLLAEELPAEQHYTVDVGEAPTALVLEASEQVDSQLRELTLMAVGDLSGQASALPADLARTLATLDHTFAQLRLELKRLASEAAAAGLDRTRLKLTLSDESVVQAQTYLRALDDIDRHARAGDMLILETPPQQRAFHRWYVTNAVALVTALRHQEPLPPVVAFEDVERHA